MTAGDAGTIVGRNLERVYGRPLGSIEKRRRMAETFEWYGRYYVESFRLPDIDLDELDRGFSYDGVGSIEAHCGPGQVRCDPRSPAPRHVGVGGVLARPGDRREGHRHRRAPQPTELFDWFVGLRQSLGMEIHPLGPDAGRQILDALKRGHLVCLLCDRDLQGNGVPVEFFGERTTLPGGPATIALRTGVPFMPAAVPGATDARHGWCRPLAEDRTHEGRSAA